jgi:Acetyl-CoA hydrolase/transferase N-terminal domain
MSPATESNTYRAARATPKNGRKPKALQLLYAWTGAWVIVPGNAALIAAVAGYQRICLRAPVMRDFESSLELISDRLMPAAAAVEVVKPGNSVFVGTACATPFTLVEALERRKPTPPDVELFHFLTSGLEPLWVERPSAYRHRCFFVGSDVRALVHSGQAEYVPISLTQIPHLTANDQGRCGFRAGLAP